MLKKITNKIYSYLFYFFSGLKSADKKMLASDNSANTLDGGGVEMNEQEDNVFKDLLRGEVTQRVRELRHEMYYAERESHKYKYVPGKDRAVKVKNLFSIDTSQLEMSDGFEVKVIQENHVISNGSENANMNLETSAYNNTYTINIERDFIPKFRLEEFAAKIVVKEVKKGVAMLDLYVNAYKSQFDVRQKMFIREMERVLDGQITDEIQRMKKLSFVTNKAAGCNDMLEFEFDQIDLDTIKLHNGYYVIKYFANVVKNGEDILKREIYDEQAAKKFETHAPREGKNNADFGIAYANMHPTNNRDNKTKEEQLLTDIYGCI